MAHHIKYGLSTGILLILAMVLLYSFKINLPGNLQLFLVGGLIIMGVLLSCKTFKTSQPEAGTNAVFFNGFRTTAIITLLALAFGVLVIQLVPSIKNDLTAKFRDDILNNLAGKDPVAAGVDAQVADYKKRFTTAFIGTNMMIFVISGLIGSFIGGIITKKK